MLVERYTQVTTFTRLCLDKKNRVWRNKSYLSNLWQSFSFLKLVTQNFMMGLRKRFSQMPRYFFQSFCRCSVHFLYNAVWIICIIWESFISFKKRQSSFISASRVVFADATCQCFSTESGGICILFEQNFSNNFLFGKKWWRSKR